MENNCYICGTPKYDGNGDILPVICDKCLKKSDTAAKLTEIAKATNRALLITEMLEAAGQVVAEANQARDHALESYNMAANVWSSAWILRNAIIKLAEMEDES